MCCEVVGEGGWGANLMFRSRPGTNFYWTLGNIIIARIFNGQPRKHEDILIEGRRISYIFKKKPKIDAKINILVLFDNLRFIFLVSLTI